MLALALPLGADAATRYVTVSGFDGPACGIDAATACRSITQAIVLASPGDTVLVGPGVYGDLNRNGVLGDIPGEETGSPGCGCAVSVNKAVIVVSSAGAGATLIDARKAYLVQNVLLITLGGEFGRPGKGFTVTDTTHITGRFYDGHGIVIDSLNTMVRGNWVLHFQDASSDDASVGILPVNDEPAVIEGNFVTGFETGIVARGAARVSRNEVFGNGVGISASSGEIAGNVATQNRVGFAITGTARATGNAAYLNTSTGFRVRAPFSGSLAKNNMVANGTDGSNCGLSNDGIAGLKGVNNYWGGVDGPGAAPANLACLGLAGTESTITAPYARKPFVVKVVTP